MFIWCSYNCCSFTMVHRCIIMLKELFKFHILSMYFTKIQQKHPISSHLLVTETGKPEQTRKGQFGEITSHWHCVRIVRPHRHGESIIRLKHLPKHRFRHVKKKSKNQPPWDIFMPRRHHKIKQTASVRHTSSRFNIIWRWQCSTAHLKSIQAWFI